MNVLVLGLYAEGSTDYSFLPRVIQRTAEQLLAEYELSAAVLVIELTKDQEKDRVESILQAARNAYGYHALIIHADADHSTPEKALRERFQPGYTMVQQSREQVCIHLLPVIPVRMIEAWMLVDPQVLRNLMKTKMSARDLGLSEKAKQVESYLDPKEILKQMVRKVYPNQPKLWNRIIAELYDDLAPLINLGRLRQVPSYQQFVNDLTETLIAINILPRIHRI